MNPKFIHLLEGLLKATQEGRVHWETTASKEAFRVSLGQGYVRIGVLDSPFRRAKQSLGRDLPEDEYEAVLLDVSGQEIESIRKIPDRPDLLVDLYSSARRDALKVDELLNDLLKSLS